MVVKEKSSAKTKSLIGTSSLEGKSLKILIVAAEAGPYAAVGGFARVVESLSVELKSLGHDVRLFSPKFGFLDEEKYKTKMVIKGLRVPTGDESTPELICNVKMHKPKNGVISYFLENMEYYEKRANVYGYSDDPTRWALLSRGALEFIRHASESTDAETQGFIPDVIHVNDWHTAVLSNFKKCAYAKDPVLSKIATVLAIHNLRFQGLFDPRNISELDFDDGKSDVAPFFSDQLAKQNFMKRGVLYSDLVVTVSPTYSREILTPEFGEGLDRLLTEVRGKLFGILNGIDYEIFNPSSDPLIEKNYDISTIDNRSANKAALQREFGLKVTDSTPLLGFVGRLDFQKGIDLVIEALRFLIKEFDVQFVLVGGGDTEIITKVKELKSTFPKNIGIHTQPNFTLPRMFFSGCDMILYPSRFEPCGIVQLEAMRYGSIPIVRKVGGLSDSVENFDPATRAGTGFVFEEFNVISFYGQLVRAIETFRHKEIWRQIQVNAMKKDFSWSRSAKEYVRIYNKAVDFKNRIPEIYETSGM